MSRKAVEDFIIKHVEMMLPGGGNKELYEAKFKAMSNAEFKQFVEDLKTGKQHLVIVCPNYSKVELDVGRNLKIAKKLGHEFFSPIITKSEDPDLPDSTTPIKSLVMMLSFRRQSQMLVSKIAIPQDTRSIDLSTYQPTGKSSKGSKLTYPEIQILAAMGLNYTIIEGIKYRGGDKGGHMALTAMAAKYGNVDLKSIEPFTTGVQSTKTLSNILTAMHLRNNLRG